MGNLSSFPLLCSNSDLCSVTLRQTVKLTFGHNHKQQFLPIDPTGCTHTYEARSHISPQIEIECEAEGGNKAVNLSYVVKKKEKNWMKNKEWRDDIWEVPGVSLTSIMAALRYEVKINWVNGLGPIFPFRKMQEKTAKRFKVWNKVKMNASAVDTTLQGAIVSGSVGHHGTQEPGSNGNGDDL